MHAFINASAASGVFDTYRYIAFPRVPKHTAAFIQHSYSIRQHTSAYVSLLQHTPAYVSICQHSSAYVSIRQHTSAYVSTAQASYIRSLRPHTLVA